MNDIEIKNKIKQIFYEVFPTLDEQNFSWNKEQKDFQNWDSFTQLNLITLIETTFEIEISLDDSIKIKSANDFLNCVVKNLS